MKKLKFYKSLLVEIIETLCSICLYLERDSTYTHNDYGKYMADHFASLKHYSENLRK